MLDEVTQGLQMLSPEEIDELDVAITPRIAAILLKVAPSLAPVLQYLIANDAPQTASAGGQPAGAPPGMQQPSPIGQSGEMSMGAPPMPPGMQPPPRRPLGMIGR
ncbi:MAG: hypothetical protein IPK75_18945 [Acidobacteria bacterium]|nr:hypothetical protein [Acidobacteriota bacterium]